MERTVVPLPNDLTSPSVARRSIAEFAAAHGLRGQATDSVVLIASEMVTNAIVHGTEPVVMMVTFRESVMAVEVADGDPYAGSVRLRAAGNPEPGGRGLRIIALLADRWGVRPSRHGKTVWATKRLSSAKSG